MEEECAGMRLRVMIEQKPKEDEGTSRASNWEKNAPEKATSLDLLPRAQLVLSQKAKLSEH